MKSTLNPWQLIVDILRGRGYYYVFLSDVNFTFAGSFICHRLETGDTMLRFSRVIFAFCATAVAQNAKITREIAEVALVVWVSMNGNNG